LKVLIPHKIKSEIRIKVRALVQYQLTCYRPIIMSINEHLRQKCYTLDSYNRPDI